MRRITMIVLLLAFAISLLGAQETEADSSREVPGKWALQFGMPDLLSVDEFLGGNISVQWKMPERVILRMGVEFSFDTHTDEHSHEFGGEDDREEQQEYARSVSLRAHLLVPGPAYGRNQLYYGIGPVLSASREYTEYEDYTYFGKADVEETMTIRSVGMQGVLGVSIRIRPGMDLFAEYNSLFTYGNSYLEREFYDSDGSLIDTESEDNRVVQIIPTGTLLGLSLYFK